jgi:hypothetical protein
MRLSAFTQLAPTMSPFHAFLTFAFAFVMFMAGANKVPELNDYESCRIT